MATVDINGTLVEFPDDLTPEQLQEAVAAAASQLPEPQKTNGVLQTIAGIADKYEQSQFGSPSQLAQSAQGFMSAGAQKAGEFVATQLAQPRRVRFMGKVYDSGSMNPTAAAALGTTVAMAPDISMTLVNPMGGTRSTIPRMAIKAQRRALGFKYPELKTPFGRGKAAEAAKVALEQGVTSATGSPDVMFNKANDLVAKSGYGIGKIREAAGPQRIQPFIKALDDYKSVRLRGATGGKWDQIAGKIDEAKDTIRGLVAKGSRAPKPAEVKNTGLLSATGKELTRKIPAVPGFTPKTNLNRIAEAKKEIGKLVNWFADNVGQEEAKKLSGVIEKATERAIAESGGAVPSLAYKGLKRIYGAGKNMLKGLNREVASQEGHVAVSLPSMIAGAAGAPSGKALASITATEFLKRRGAGIAASELMGLANAPTNLAVPGAKIIQVLTEEKARQILKEAKGNKEKARQIAKDRGYEVK